MRFHLRGTRRPIGHGSDRRAASRATLLVFVLAAATAVVGCSASASSDLSRSTLHKVSDATAYGELPLAFEENRGQSAGDVRFLSRGDGFTAFLTPSGVTLALRQPAELDGDDSQSESGVEYATIGMRLVGVADSPAVEGLDELDGKTNYFVSSDPDGWHLGVPTYSKVRYVEAYPGIDLEFYGNRRTLEYNFIVSPGSDPDLIGLSFQGADSVALDEDGNLALGVGGGTVLHRAPVTYQLSNGVREIVDSRYALRAVAIDEAGGTEYRIGFDLGAYDHTRPLIIDPEISYSSYLGGSKLD